MRRVGAYCTEKIRPYEGLKPRITRFYRQGGIIYRPQEKNASETVLGVFKGKGV